MFEKEKVLNLVDKLFKSCCNFKKVFFNQHESNPKSDMGNRIRFINV